jgi:predicted RNA methylase
MKTTTDLLSPEGLAELLEELQKKTISDDVLIKLEYLVNKNLPHWHIPMLNDLERNEFYKKMINRHVKDKTVFEIGTGVGLLAIMAAEAGATHVHTCEMNELMYLLAFRNISRSKFKDKITLHFGSSRDLKLGEHIPEKVDIILSEIISNDIIAEDILDSLHDAKRFLKKDGIFLPQEIQAHGSLVNLKNTSYWMMENDHELTRELDLLFRFKKQSANLTKTNHTKISKTINLFSIKDGSHVNPKLPITFKLKVDSPQRSGKNNYFCLHFTIKDGRNIYESYNPISGVKHRKHWHQSIWYVGVGETYKFKLMNEDDRLYLVKL